MPGARHRSFTTTASAHIDGASRLWRRVLYFIFWRITSRSGQQKRTTTTRTKMASSRKRKERAVSATPPPSSPQFPPQPQTPGLSLGFAGMDQSPQARQQQLFIQDRLTTGAGNIDSGEAALAAYSNISLPFLGALTLGQWQQDFESSSVMKQQFLVQQLMDGCDTALDSVIGFIVHVSNYLTSREELMVQYGGVDQFLTRYPTLKNARAMKTNRAREVSAAIDSIKILEPGLIDTCIMRYMNRILLNHAGVTDMRFVLRRLEMRAASSLVNACTVARLQTKHKKKDRYVNPGDWTNAKDKLKDFCEFAEGKSNANNPDALAGLLSEVRRHNMVLADITYNSQLTRPYLRPLLPDGTPNPHYEFWLTAWKAYRFIAGNSDMYTPASVLAKLGVRKHPTFGLLVPSETTFGTSKAIEATTQDIVEAEKESLGAQTPEMQSRLSTPLTNDEETARGRPEEKAAGEKIVQARRAAPDPCSDAAPINARAPVPAQTLRRPLRTRGQGVLDGADENPVNTVNEGFTIGEVQAFAAVPEESIPNRSHFVKLRPPPRDEYYREWDGSMTQKDAYEQALGEEGPVGEEEGVRRQLRSQRGLSTEWTPSSTPQHSRQSSGLSPVPSYLSRQMPPGGSVVNTPFKGPQQRGPQSAHCRQSRLSSLRGHSRERLRGLEKRQFPPSGYVPPHLRQRAGSGGSGSSYVSPNLRQRAESGGSGRLGQTGSIAESLAEGSTDAQSRGIGKKWFLVCFLGMVICYMVRFVLFRSFA